MLCISGKSACRLLGNPSDLYLLTKIHMHADMPNAHCWYGTCAQINLVCFNCYEQVKTYL